MQLSIFEAVNGTNFENPTAILGVEVSSGDPVAPADRQVTLVSGQTLTFTELIGSSPVVMYASTEPITKANASFRCVRPSRRPTIPCAPGWTRRVSTSW